MPPDQYFEILFQENNLLFKEQHQHLLGKIPFKNFDFPIEHAILKSGKNLIIETFQDSVDCVAYSEKTWRSIQLPRPWLLFGPMYSVRHLRQWGFDVFDDYIDHSYDNETSSITRQSMILEQLKMPIIYNEEILKNFESRVQHNRDLLKKLAQAWPSKLKNTLNTLINISSIESSTSRA